MSRSRNQRATVLVVNDMSCDAGVDPDFDSWDGELTMAQWRDPSPPQWYGPADTGKTAQLYRPYISYEAWKHQLRHARRKRLDEVVERLWKTMFDQLHDRRKRLKTATDRLHWLLWGERYPFQAPGPRWVQK